MKRIVQSLKNGEISIISGDIPQIPQGHVLVRVQKSLISPGTERMLLDFGKSNWIRRAKNHPDKVKLAIDKIKSDGFLDTISTINTKLSSEIELGYSCVGIVEKVGKGVTDFEIGNRVLCNGPHAEYVVVPKHLCAKIPQAVKDDDAVFGILASIGLQGVRLICPNIGECYAVFGLGIIGLLTTQILKASGCKVIAIDFNEERLKLAEKVGCISINANDDDAIRKASHLASKGFGIDGAIISTATKSNGPVDLAAEICRQRGKIVLVGVAGTNISRDRFYKKELSFQVSCSYGPGRYDHSYEVGGVDYPFGLVRWTENRNIEACLDLMLQGCLVCSEYISDRYTIDDAKDAYESLGSKNNSHLGFLIYYPENSSSKDELNHEPTAKISQHHFLTNEHHGVSLVGAGAYATKFLIPSIKAAKLPMRFVVSQKGLSSIAHKGKNGFVCSSTVASDAINDELSSTIIIATRHNTHADMVIEGLRANKNIYVEKPLCIYAEELEEIQKCYFDLVNKNNGSTPQLMVGFNRRFSPLSQKFKTLSDKIAGPKVLTCSVNAGEIDLAHWIQNPDIGGGRIIGEVCHFLDFFTFVLDARIVDYSKYIKQSHNRDTLILSLKYSDGSIAQLNYLTEGNKAFPKERYELHADGKSLILNNFRTLQGFGWPDFKSIKLFRQNKGNAECLLSFLKGVQNNSDPLIPVNEIFETSRLAIELARN